MVQNGYVCACVDERVFVCLMLVCVCGVCECVCVCVCVRVCCAAHVGFSPVSASVLFYSFLVIYQEFVACVCV